MPKNTENSHTISNLVQVFKYVCCILYAVWDGGVSLVDRYLIHICIIQGPGKGDRDFVCQEGVNRIYVFLVALVSHSSIRVVS
jgi:hypothetical protein